MVSSGNMLATAAICEGKNVIQTASYGGSQRGGSSIAEVIISDHEILFQRVQDPDIVMALNDVSMNLYASLSEKGVPIFYDTTLVAERNGENLFGFPFTGMANEMGNAAMANVIGLGVLISQTGILKPESLEEVIEERFSGKILQMNLQALQKGISLITQQ